MPKKTNNQDWANLNRYQNKNATLEAPALAENRIVFMGDSITEAWKTICPEFFLDKSYVNRGIGGQTSPQMLLRFRADVIDLKPKMVVILAGTNDIAGNTGATTLEMILGNIISMCELTKANNIKVILCSVLPAHDFPWKRGLEPAEKIIALNTMIKQYADTNAILYLDYFSHLVDLHKGIKTTYSNDGVHPNKAGYLVMAPLVTEAIDKVLI